MPSLPGGDPEANYCSGAGKPYSRDGGLAIANSGNLHMKALEIIKKACHSVFGSPKEASPKPSSSVQWITGAPLPRTFSNQLTRKNNETTQTSIRRRSRGSVHGYQ